MLTSPPLYVRNAKLCTLFLITILLEIRQKNMLYCTVASLGTFREIISRFRENNISLSRK